MREGAAFFVLDFDEARAAAFPAGSAFALAAAGDRDEAGPALAAPGSALAAGLPFLLAESPEAFGAVRAFEAGAAFAFPAFAFAPAEAVRAGAAFASPAFAFAPVEAVRAGAAFVSPAFAFAPVEAVRAGAAFVSPAFAFAPVEAVRAGAAFAFPAFAFAPAEAARAAAFVSPAFAFAPAEAVRAGAAALVFFLPLRAGRSAVFPVVAKAVSEGATVQERRRGK